MHSVSIIVLIKLDNNLLVVYFTKHKITFSILKLTTINLCAKEINACHHTYFFFAEEIPVEVKRSSTTTTTTTTTQRPSRPKSTSPPFYTTSAPPTTTRGATKVITSHHFPVVHSPDIRFNPEEINISLNPDSPPDITRSQIPISFQQQSYSNSEKNTRVTVTTHTTIYKHDKPHRVPLLPTQNSPSQILVEHQNVESPKIVQTTQTPKSVVSYGLTHNNQGSQVATPTEINYGFTYQQTEENVEYNTEVPPHPYQYQLNIANLRPPTAQAHPYHSSYTTSRRPHNVNYPTPTTYRSHPAYTSSAKISTSQHYHSQRTEKPPRLQLPLPLLPTLPPLTFSSPAPFSLGRHIETKRYTNDHHSPPRIIISASASVSDNSGRRLNYSLGTIGATELIGPSPATYDDYREEDVGLDPFYHDVPKIKSLRHKREAGHEEEIIKNEQEAADLLKYLFNWYTRREKKKQITIPVASEDITEINEELAPLAQAEPSASTEEEYANLFNKLNSDNFTENFSEVEKDLRKNLTQELQINTTEITETKINENNQGIVEEKKVDISSITEKSVPEIAKEQTHEGNHRRRINKPRTTTNRRTKKPKIRRKPQSEQVSVSGNDSKLDEKDSRSRSRSRSRSSSRKIDNIPDELEVPKPTVRLLADVTIDENNTHTVFIEEYPNFKESSSRKLEIHSKDSTSTESPTSHIPEPVLKEDKKDKVVIEKESPSEDIVKEEKPPLEVYELLGEPYPSLQTNFENNAETSNNESHSNDQKTQATVTKNEQSKDDHVKNEDYKHFGNINVTTNDIQNDEKHSTKPYYDDESRKIKTTTSPYSTPTVVETLTPLRIEENTTIDHQNHVIEGQNQELNKTAELLYSLAVVESNHENLDAQPSSYRHEDHYYYDMGEEENIDRDNFDDAKSEIENHDRIEATTQNIPDENNEITTKLPVKDEKSEIVTETETPEVEAPPAVPSSDYSEKQDDLEHEVEEEKHDKPIEDIEITTLPSEVYQENQDIVEQRKETEDSDKIVESPESQNIDYENKQDVVTTPASEDHTEEINVEKEENEETKLDKLSENMETQEKLREDYPETQEKLSKNYPERQDFPKDNNEEQNEFSEGDKNKESEDQVSDKLATDLQNEEEQHNEKHEEKDSNTDSKFENEKEEEVTDTPNDETTTVSDTQNNPEDKSVVQNVNEQVKTENPIENIEIETTPSALSVPENPTEIQNESDTSSKHSFSHDKLEQQSNKEEELEHHSDKEELHSSKIQSKDHSRNRSRGRNRYKFASRRNFDVSSDGEETPHNPKIHSRNRSKSKIEESRHVENNYVRNRKYIPTLSDNRKNLENTEDVKTYSSKNSKKEEHVVIPDYVDDNYEPLTYHQKPAEVKELEDFTSKNDLISNKDTDIKDAINSDSTENPVKQEKETPEDNTERVEELTTTDYPKYLTTNDYTQHIDEQTTILTTQTAEITTSEIPAIETTTEDETQHIHETTTALPTSSEYEQTTNTNTESTLDASKNLDATVSYTTEAMTTPETTQATTVPTIVSTTNSPSSIVTLTEPEVQVVVTTPMSEVSTTTKHTRIRISSSRRRNNNNNVRKTEQSTHRFNTRRKGLRGRTRSDVLNNHNSVSSSHSSVNELLIDKHTTNNTAKLSDTESVVSSSTTPTNINNNDYNLEIKHNVDDTTMKQLHSIVLTTVNPRDAIQTTIIPTLPTLMESINSGENRAEIPITDAPLIKSANPTKAKYTKIIFTTTPLSKLVRVELRKDMHGRRYSFNCFNKKVHEFYSDPRDCRLFHYCTSGYSKNQMVDMKFVCDLGTYFDDEKLICTKTKPARCL